MVLPAGETYNWTESWLTLAFAAGTRLDVESADFNASGLTFTASNPSQGWLGIRYNPGSGGTLSGTSAQPTVVERVTGGCPPNTCFTSGVDAAITVESASPTFSGVTIRLPTAGTYLHGLRVMGPNASPLATGLKIFDMTGSAVYAHAGATPELRGLGVNLTLNHEAAVFAAGAGTHVRLVAAPSGGALFGPQMTGGLGGGVQATTLAQVSFNGGSGGLGFANIDGNAGRGLSASGDADLFAGTTVVQSRNRILRNGGTGATGNGRASGTGSTVSARCNWWGTADPASFRVGAVSGATFNASRWLTGDPYLDPDVPCVNANGAAARSGATAFGRTGGAGATAGEDGGSTSPADRLADAMELAPAEQLAELIALIADQPATPEAASALSVAGALATAGATPVGVAADAVALLDTYAGSGTVETLQRAALGALVGVRLGTGDAAGALGAADALVALGGGAARTGHAARVFVLGADDTAASLDALAALDAGWPGSDEAEAARAHLAALGVAVPGNRAAAGGSDILDDLPAEASAVVADVSTTALAVSPNPSVAGAVVTLTLADAADVRVAVYDLVGREVAVLRTGEAAAGSHATTVPAGLAPGAYVVRAVAAGVVVATARLVVVR